MMHEMVPDVYVWATESHPKSEINMETKISKFRRLSMGLYISQVCNGSPLNKWGSRALLAICT